MRRSTSVYVIETGQVWDGRQWYAYPGRARLLKAYWHDLRAFNRHYVVKINPHGMFMLISLDREISNGVQYAW